MFVRLRVEGAADGLEDIQGTIGIDDIEIEQFPQLLLETDLSRGVYRLNQPVLASATILGMKQRELRVRFELRDHHDLLVASVSKPIPPPTRGNGNPKGDVGFTHDTATNDAVVRWQLPKLPAGFYRLGAALEKDDRRSLATDTTIAVIGTFRDQQPSGPFGWTLAHHRPDQMRNIDWSPEETAKWLASLGVAWLKYPCWLGPNDLLEAERINTLFRKLNDEGIQVIGMLDSPPQAMLDSYGLHDEQVTVAANLFRDQAAWRSQLEPVMMQLTLKCRMWQLGGESDFSFLGRPGLRELIRGISVGLGAVGQPLDIALSWPWQEPLLEATDISWQAVCRSAQPSLTPAELDDHLKTDSKDRRQLLNQWVLLNPIPKSDYTLEARIRDLVLRMATVRGHRVQAAFVSDPTHPETGLLRTGNRPGELLLPWRTTAQLLGNTRRLGSIDLPSGSQNTVFVGETSSVMMVWSDSPKEELIYLGDDIKHIDVWGRDVPFAEERAFGHRVQRIQIGRLPTFVTGVDPTLSAFRMSVALAPDHLDSLLEQSQNIQVTFTNPTQVSLLGTMRIDPPRGWKIRNAQRPWEMIARRSSAEDFELFLDNMATVDEYKIPIHFEFQTVPPRTITVQRKLKVGPADMELKITPRLLGTIMLVQLEFTNTSTRRLSYRCHLFPQNGRQDERLRVSIDPGKTVKQYFRLANGEELIGKTMWLRAIEQDTQRILNYRVTGSR